MHINEHGTPSYQENTSFCREQNTQSNEMKLVNFKKSKNTDKKVWSHINVNPKHEWNPSPGFNDRQLVLN